MRMEFVETMRLANFEVLTTAKARISEEQRHSGREKTAALRLEKKRWMYTGPTWEAQNGNPSLHRDCVWR
jgi:hypothetical protein